MKRLLFVVSEDWYFVSHRLHLAIAAIESGYTVALLSHTSNYRDLIESSGIEVIDWSLDRQSRNLASEAKAIFGVVKALRYFQPDLVHAVAMKPVLYASIACRVTGIQSRVFALGGLGFIFSSQKALARLLKPFIVTTFRWALNGHKARLILQNHDDEALLLNYQVIEKSRISLIRGAGVDTDSFSPNKTTQNIPLIALSGRLLWDKGVGVFVKCARALSEKGVQGRFILVGEPDLHNPESIPVSQLQDWVDEGVIEWWGRRNDMPEVLRQVAVVCLPTTYGEGLPKALLEAASCGLPIVTYDVPGCREIVIDGVNGFIVPPNDEVALFSAVETLLNNPELRILLGKAGRELVIKEFSQETVAAETMQVWDEVLN
ncbi:glycosyltransferase family 4 protein [Pseudomonadota bacterium]